LDTVGGCGQKTTTLSSQTQSLDRLQKIAATCLGGPAVSLADSTANSNHFSSIVFGVPRAFDSYRPDTLGGGIEIKSCCPSLLRPAVSSSLFEPLVRANQTFPIQFPRTNGQPQ